MKFDLISKSPRWLWAVIAVLLISTGWWGTSTFLNKKPVPEGRKFSAKVVVPDHVRGRWDGVKLAIYRRGEQTAQPLMAHLGESTPIPGSNATLQVKTFLPAFMADGTTLTSASNSPTNPGAEIIISEGGKELFHGWLMARTPVSHALQHPEFSVVLLEGIPRR